MHRFFNFFLGSFSLREFYNYFRVKLSQRLLILTNLKFLTQPDFGLLFLCLGLQFPCLRLTYNWKLLKYGLINFFAKIGVGSLIVEHSCWNSTLLVSIGNHIKNHRAFLILKMADICVKFNWIFISFLVKNLKILILRVDFLSWKIKYFVSRDKLNWTFLSLWDLSSI